MSSLSQAPTQVQRVRFEEEGEYTLCFLEFQDIRDADEALAIIAAARETIAQTPPFSLRVLTDVSNSHMSLPVIVAMQDFARANAPHTTKSAVIGLSLPHRVALRQIRRLTGRDIREFASRDEAMAYLRG
jgi:hypothetical protein